MNLTQIKWLLDVENNCNIINIYLGNDESITVSNIKKLEILDWEFARREVSKLDFFDHQLDIYLKEAKPCEK